MDRILQDGQLSAMIPFSMEEPVLLFPVRHHSPVCSYHLVRTIAAYHPECILIEGPENASFLIPVLTQEDTQLPAAIYYFYKDKKKYVNDEGKDYHCYYPFLPSSPEYNAMAEAGRQGIPAEFIDLPYSEILICTKEKQGLRSEQEGHSYSDDRHLVQSRFFQKLCEKTNLRSFDEFWEKYFEIQGIFITPEEFVRQMHTYCILTRQDVPHQLLEADGTLARERHMAHRIRENMQKYNRILVVTGGFHSLGLYKLLQEPLRKPARLHKFSPDVENCYPMAYSYEAADALNGYASGMPHPAYYGSICRDLLQGSSPDGIYNRRTLEMLIQTAKQSAQKNIPISTADVTAAYSLAKGLAALRGVRECGMTETADGVTAAFIKGEKTAASSLPLRLLQKLAAGDSVGHISSREHVPPLVMDFEKQCRTFRLKVSSVRNSAELSLFVKEKNMEESRFFHRMRYLGTGFAKREKGPDLHSCKDRSRVREIWNYRMQPHVTAALIDRTPDGSTLAEACRTAAGRELASTRQCEAAARTAVDCFLMGIPFPDTALAEEILSEDGDIFSVGGGLRYCRMLCELQELYGFSDKRVLEYTRQCFEKLLVMLPSAANIPSERADGCIKIMRELYGAAGSLFCDRQEDLKETLSALIRRPEKEPSVYGAAMGLLYALDSRFRQEAENAMQSFLRGSIIQKKQGAAYLKGLFETARDIALTDRKFLEMTDTLITAMDFPDFQEVLPSLRLAFSHFTPAEIQQAAEEAAALHKTTGENVLYTAPVDERQMAFGRQLDREICEEEDGYGKS